MKTARYVLFIDIEDSEEFEKMMKVKFPKAEVNFDSLSDEY